MYQLRCRATGSLSVVAPAELHVTPELRPETKIPALRIGIGVPIGQEIPEVGLAKRNEGMVR